MASLYSLRGIGYSQDDIILGVIVLFPGCKLLLYPGAFNTTTGPMHWELLIRALLVYLTVHLSTYAYPCTHAGQSIIRCL